MANDPEIIDYEPVGKEREARGCLVIPWTILFALIIFLLVMWLTNHGD